MHNETTTKNAKIPVSVLTGYLGAGKTTLLNRILNAKDGKRYAVIVNEFGEIGIDNELIVQSDEDIYELNNGCVCCTVRGDLIRVVERLMRRKDRFDAIIIETTGLADPVPVAQTFFMDDEVRAKTELDCVIGVVDAKHLPLRLKDSREAEDQIAFSDIILLNKTDLVSEEQLKTIENTIYAINPSARLYRTQNSDIALDKILNQGAFDLKKALDTMPEFLEEHHECGPDCDHDHHHHHHDHHSHDHSHAHGALIHDVSITSIALEAGSLQPKKFFAWISHITQTKGADILRLKGILAFENDDERYVIQGIHMLLEGDHQRPWRPDEARKSRLVFIGRHLNRAQLEQEFKALI